jgi:hypothetical protein
MYLSEKNNNNTGSGPVASEGVENLASWPDLGDLLINAWANDLEVCMGTTIE